MKLTKVAFAIASVLAVAAGTANAGNFQTNSTSVAREVIVGDAQAIVSPQVSYSFAGPVRDAGQPGACSASKSSKSFLAADQVPP